MKYFSLSFHLTEKDYADYEKIVFKGSIFLSLKRMIFPLGLIMIFSLFIDYSVAVFALFYLAIAILMPQAVSREFSHKTRKASLLLKREMNVDFYDNHISVSYRENEKIRSHSVRHYGFERIKSILESRENIYFAFGDNSLLIIPKAKIEAEKYEMIKNLINNLFSNKYQILGN